MKDRGEEMKIAALPKAKYRVMMVKKMSDRRLHEEMLIQMIKSHDTQRSIGAGNNLHGDWYNPRVILYYAFRT